MLSHGFAHEATPAENAVLDEIAGVLVGHLDAGRGDGGPPRSPILIQIDGPGRTLFLDKVAHGLAGGWTVIHFDAWQYQRVAPPWWWLIKAIDQQVGGRGQGFVSCWRRRLRDYRWRAGQLLDDLGVVGPPFLFFAILCAAAWWLSGKVQIAEILQWTTTVIAGLSALVGIAWSGTNAVRRHLLVASPAGAKAVLQTSDPMSDLMARYKFLIRSAGTPVAILVDNLDRCRGEYVVELLEGIQTLFRDSTADDDLPMVAYIIAADGGWLCESYLNVYEEFKETMKEPGRPFGRAFLDKIFDLSLRIPTVPAATSGTRLRGADEVDAAARAKTTTELDVRETVVGLEDGGPPDLDLRLQAVRQIAELEYRSPRRTCPDTDFELTQLEALIEPGPAIVRHLRPAYCVQRTMLLLAEHELDADELAIRRLGLWTILTLRWPLLAEHLSARPDDIHALRDDEAPEHVDERLAPLFGSLGAKRFAEQADAFLLDADAIRRFTVPIDLRAYVATAQRSA